MYETAFECDGWLLIGRSKATVFFPRDGSQKQPSTQHTSPLMVTP